MVFCEKGYNAHEEIQNACNYYRDVSCCSGTCKCHLFLALAYLFRLRFFGKNDDHRIVGEYLKESLNHIKKAKEILRVIKTRNEKLLYCYKYVVFDGVLYDAINRWLLHAPDITLLGIDHLNLPEGLLCIDNYAFEDCPNISYLQIPDSVITIGEDAFKGCSNLTLLVYPESYAA